MQIQYKDWEWGFKLHPKTLPQYLDSALTTFVTVHTDKKIEQIW
jgi:hypothetical protein